MTTTIERTKETKTPVIHEMTLVSPNRNSKDIGKLKASIERAESILVPNRYQLYDLYHDITTIDGHLSGIMNKRIEAITNKSLHFVDKAGKTVDDMDSLIKSQKFLDLITLIMNRKFWGLAGAEFVIGKEFNWKEIPRKHIRPEKRVICKSQYDNDGVNIDTLPFCWVLSDAYDLGILLRCAMYALYKRNSFGDFAQFVEIFGQPVRVIYYDAYDTQTKSEISKILNESGSSLAMMIPKQAQFEMMDGKTSNANGDLQINFIRVCNDEMSIAVLGNTETTTSSKSSGYAQSKEHGKQQLEITKSDLQYVENMLNDPQFLKIVASYGFPVEGGKFEFEKELDLDGLKVRLEIDTAVSEKVPVSDDYWYSTYGIPKPDNYDELKKKQEEREEMEMEEEEVQKQTPGKQMSKKGKKVPDDDEIIITKKQKSLLAYLSDLFFFGSEELINLQDYYKPCQCGCDSPSLHNLADMPESVYDDIARQLLESKIAEGEIPYELYSKTAEQLIAAIGKGLGGESFNYDDTRNVLKSYLERNIYSFSAAKSLTEMVMFRSLMTDENGEIKPFYKFRRDIAAQGKLFNDVYLQTEYDTALQSSIMAHKWETMDTEYLEYSTAGDNRVRPYHKLLEGKTYPKDHSFWNKYYPPLDWNCRCTVIPGVGSKVSGEDFSFTKEINVPPMFENNVGKTKVIFKNDHPYFVASNGKTPKLSWKQYGLKSEEKIKTYDLPKRKQSNRADFEAFWENQKKHNGDDIVWQDKLGNTILFDSYDTSKHGNRTDYFKQHIFKKEDRSLYSTRFKEIVSNPDEIWDDGKASHYIKFYKDETVTVVVNNEKLIAKTMYSISGPRLSETRSGLLKYKSR